MLGFLHGQVNVSLVQVVEIEPAGVTGRKMSYSGTIHRINGYRTCQILPKTRDLPDTSLSAGRPHEAEVLCEKNRERIDLLLCDVVMHELSGAELSKRRR